MGRNERTNLSDKSVKVTALTGYLGIFFLIGFFSKNDFARFHAKQGLAVLLCEAFSAALILAAAAFIEFGSSGHSILVGAATISWLLSTVLRVIGIANAGRNLKKPLFLTGRLAARL
jgi:uncharacterized membrane protein